MADRNVYQQLGMLQAKVEALELQSATMDGKLDTLLERSAKSAGARSMLWKVGTISSACTTLVIAVASWWVDTFGSRGPHP
jgi:hypothetical protein